MNKPVEQKTDDGAGMETVVLLKVSHELAQVLPKMLQTIPRVSEGEALAASPLGLAVCCIGSAASKAQAAAK